MRRARALRDQRLGIPARRVPVPDTPELAQPPSTMLPWPHREYRRRGAVAQAKAFDEMSGLDGEVRAPYAEIARWLRATPRELLHRKRQEAEGGGGAGQGV